MINTLIRISNIHLSSVPPFLWVFCSQLHPPYLCANNIIIPMAVTGTGMLYSWHPSKVRCRYSDGFPKGVTIDFQGQGQQCLGVKIVWGQQYFGVKHFLVQQFPWVNTFGGLTQVMDPQSTISRVYITKLNYQKIYENSIRARNMFFTSKWGRLL